MFMKATILKEQHLSKQPIKVYKRDFLAVSVEVRYLWEFLIQSGWFTSNKSGCDEIVILSYTVCLFF